jgi:hypothetical protein
MLDLSYLVGTSPAQPDHAAHSIALDDLDAAYLNYQQRALSHDPNAALMTREAFNNYSLDDSWLANIKQLAKRTIITSITCSASILKRRLTPAMSFIAIVWRRVFRVQTAKVRVVHVEYCNWIA